jgi:hypothetical protein
MKKIEREKENYRKAEKMNEIGTKKSKQGGGRFL